MTVPTSLPPSIVRTVVPIVVGWISTWLPAELGITSEQLAAVVGTVVAALWYVGARVLEVYVSPRFGWLLGWATAPEYQPRHRAGDPPLTAA